MLSAAARASRDLLDRRILRILWASMLSTLVLFAGCWYAADRAMSAVWPSGGPFRGLIGGLATLAALWFLFSTVVSSLIGLFLERVATIVEARHYPHLAQSTGQRWYVAILVSLRFFGLLLLTNVVLLLLLWLVPPLYLVAALLGNGWLVGREYFELIALRRVDLATARRLRSQHALELLAAGALLTLLAGLPGINLIVPVFATALLVHRFEAWRSQATGGG